MASARYGLIGLIVFEAVVAGFVLTFGAWELSLIGLVALGALAWAFYADVRGAPLPRAAIIVLVAATAARALLQSASGIAPAIAPSFLVPIGFALLLAPQYARHGVLLIALARSWFVVWYAIGGAPVVAFANLAGALGVWAWWGGASPEEPAPERATG